MSEIDKSLQECFYFVVFLSSFIKWGEDDTEVPRTFIASKRFDATHVMCDIPAVAVVLSSEISINVFLKQIIANSYAGLWDSWHCYNAGSHSVLITEAIQPFGDSTWRMWIVNFIIVLIQDGLSNCSDERVLHFLEQLRQCFRKQLLTMTSAAFLDLNAFNRGSNPCIQSPSRHDRPIGSILGAKRMLSETRLIHHNWKPILEHPEQSF